MSSSNGMPWLKLYTEARNDAKLRSLTDAEHRVWFQLLCFAGEQEERGTIKGYDEELLAVEVCNADVALLRVTLVTLTKFRIISMDENAITFCAFDRRQGSKPSDSKERVKSRVAKHRAKARQADVTPVTPLVTPRNAVKRLDKEEEEEKDTDIYAPTSLTVVPRQDKEEPEGEPLTRTRATSHASGHVKNPHWDALVEAFGYEPKTTAERSKWGKVVADLKKSDVPADDILRAKANYDRDVELGVITWTLSPLALVAHLGELLQPERRANPSRPRAGQNGHLVAVPDIPSTIPRLVRDQQ